MQTPNKRAAAILVQTLVDHNRSFRRKSAKISRTQNRSARIGWKPFD